MAWSCPKCGRVLARRGAYHACTGWSVDEHFERCDPEVRAIFDAIVAAARACGEVELTARKTRIGLRSRITFGAVRVRRRYLLGHLLLRRRDGGRRWEKIEDGPPYWVHHFRMERAREVDGGFRALVREAYRS